MRGHADEKRKPKESHAISYRWRGGDVDRWVGNSRYGVDKERDVENERAGDRGRKYGAGGVIRCRIRYAELQRRRRADAGLGCR